MGFLKRLLSVGSKKKRKDDHNAKSKRNSGLLGRKSKPELQPQEQEAVVNRLLRSSSTHFSVLSETEYRSLPPIPHPINNVLRAPSIVSNATQTDTYTVTVHRRMLHSRTEFPNANRSGSSSVRSSSASPTRRHSLPPLTPGDKNRLARLRQDASVLSLLDIYDDKGNPDSRAFSNTPARTRPSLRALMGSPSAPNVSLAVEESDLSWADRHIRGAHRNSFSSVSTTSSLGIPVNLFKGSITPERLLLDHDVSETSRETDVGIDSMQVERGTVEDAVPPSVAALTSPTRRASQFFKFLAEVERPLPALPVALPPCDVPMFVRDGPWQSQACVSPPPRSRSRPPPLPPVPAQYRAQYRAQMAKLPRAPFDEVRNADAVLVTARSVSVASSVHPQIETHDPYTPVSSRRTTDGKKYRHSSGENIPPNAPQRPSRRHTRAPTARPVHNKENDIIPLTLKPEKIVPVVSVEVSTLSVPPRATHLATPSKNPAHAHLQEPSRPSPASSSELSPHGRQIMANIRAKARKASHGKSWQSWGGQDDSAEA